MDVPRCYSIAEASRATSLHRAIIMAAIHAGELAIVHDGPLRPPRHRGVAALAGALAHRHCPGCGRAGA